MTLHDLAEANAVTGVTSLTPAFPRAVAPTEHFALYRHTCSRVMRTWLTYAISDLLTFPTDEHDARVVAEELAIREIGRPLHAHETRLLGEAVRDLLTVKVIGIDIAREDAAREFAREVWTRNGRFANEGMFMEEAQEQQRLTARDEAYLLRQVDIDALADAVHYVYQEQRAKEKADLLDTQQRLARPGRMLSA